MDKQPDNRKTGYCIIYSKVCFGTKNLARLNLNQATTAEKYFVALYLEPDFVASYLEGDYVASFMEIYIFCCNRITFSSSISGKHLANEMKWR